MASTIKADNKYCLKCGKTRNFTFRCAGCAQDFCNIHINEHRQELNRQMTITEDQYNEFRSDFKRQISETVHPRLLNQIDQWEKESIDKIRTSAQHMRRQLSTCIESFTLELDCQSKELVKEMQQYRKDDDDFGHHEIDQVKEKLEQLKVYLRETPQVKIKHQSTSFIDRIQVVSDYASWIPDGVVVAGGNDKGAQLNQLDTPWGLCIDPRDQTIYVADYGNDRIVEWKPGALEGRIIAGGKGRGSGDRQLNGPVDVIIDVKNNDLIIADRWNRRVVRRCLQNPNKGRTIISNIQCFGVMMDENDRSLYVVDDKKHAVRRYLEGETGEGTIVAGGNGQGDGLHQLSNPRYVFVDQDQSVYVSDQENHRVMKWKKDAKEGIVVAGGQGQGNGLEQLSSPNGLVVDKSGNIYVCESGGGWVTCWNERRKECEVIIGGDDDDDDDDDDDKTTDNEQISLFGSTCLCFDAQGNLYVTDSETHRVLKFSIDENECNVDI